MHDHWWNLCVWLLQGRLLRRWCRSCPLKRTARSTDTCLLGLDRVYVAFEGFFRSIRGRLWMNGLDNEWSPEFMSSLQQRHNKQVLEVCMHGSVIFPCQCRGGVLRSVYCAWEYSTGHEVSPLMLSPWASWSGINTWEVSKLMGTPFTLVVVAHYNFDMPR